MFHFPFHFSYTANNFSSIYRILDFIGGFILLLCGIEVTSFVSLHVSTVCIQCDDGICWSDCVGINMDSIWYDWIWTKYDRWWFTNGIE